jgi:hypothetical protein
MASSTWRRRPVQRRADCSMWAILYEVLPEEEALPALAAE